jgi:hypothetical protein
VSDFTEAYGSAMEAIAQSSVVNGTLIPIGSSSSTSASAVAGVHALTFGSSDFLVRRSSIVGPLTARKGVAGPTVPPLEAALAARMLLADAAAARSLAGRTRVSGRPSETTTVPTDHPS